MPTKHVFVSIHIGNLLGKGWRIGFLYVICSCVFVTFPYAVLSQVWCMIGFYLSLSYEKLFERKSKLVRDGLMFVKGHLLTTEG